MYPFTGSRFTVQGCVFSLLLSFSHGEFHFEWYFVSSSIASRIARMKGDISG